MRQMGCSGEPELAVEAGAHRGDVAVQHELLQRLAQQLAVDQEVQWPWRVCARGSQALQVAACK